MKCGFLIEDLELQPNFSFFSRTIGVCIANAERTNLYDSRVVTCRVCGCRDRRSILFNAGPLVTLPPFLRTGIYFTFAINVLLQLLASLRVRTFYVFFSRFQSPFGFYRAAPHTRVFSFAASAVCLRVNR